MCTGYMTLQSCQWAVSVTVDVVATAALHTAELAVCTRFEDESA